MNEVTEVIEQLHDHIGKIVYKSKKFSAQDGKNHRQHKYLNA